MAEQITPAEHDDYVLISALNQYSYCPLRCYWMFVEHEFTDNEHTIEGTLGHSRVHAEGQTTRGDLFQLRSVYLYSQRYGISGSVTTDAHLHPTSRIGRGQPALSGQ